MQLHQLAPGRCLALAHQLGDQRLNAEALVQSGGALLRNQPDATSALLAAEIEAIRADPARRAAMRQALLQLAEPDAAEKLADLVCNQ